jgi:hypothetical protein
MLKSLWVLQIIPIVQTKAALPRFGHAQIVLVCAPRAYWAAVRALRFSA